MDTRARLAGTTARDSGWEKHGRPPSRGGQSDKRRAASENGEGGPRLPGPVPPAAWERRRAPPHTACTPLSRGWRWVGGVEDGKGRRGSYRNPAGVRPGAWAPRVPALTGQSLRGGRGNSPVEGGVGWMPVRPRRRRRRRASRRLRRADMRAPGTGGLRLPQCSGRSARTAHPGPALATHLLTRRKIAAVTPEIAEPPTSLPPPSGAC